jgi:hypothetical protein
MPVGRYLLIGIFSMEKIGQLTRVFVGSIG